jgi:hypothetical protein
LTRTRKEAVMSGAPAKAEANGADLITEAVADCIREVGEVPSGHLYAMLTGVLTLNEYSMVIAILRARGDVTQRGHLLCWVGQESLVNVK